MSFAKIVDEEREALQKLKMDVFNALTPKEVADLERHWYKYHPDDNSVDVLLVRLTTVFPEHTPKYLRWALSQITYDLFANLYLPVK